LNNKEYLFDNEDPQCVFRYIHVALIFIVQHLSIVCFFIL